MNTLETALMNGSPTHHIVPDIEPLHENMLVPQDYQGHILEVSTSYSTRKGGPAPSSPCL